MIVIREQKTNGRKKRKNEMKKFASFLCVVLALTFGIVLTPILSSAAEFSYPGPPAFMVPHPSSCVDIDKISPEQIWYVKCPNDIYFEAYVWPIAEGVDLKDSAGKIYKPILEKSQAASAKISGNKEITLSDGTKANYTEMNWMTVLPPNPGYGVVTMVVTAYKDGKAVTVVAHAWMDANKYEKLVKSLTFK